MNKFAKMALEGAISELTARAIDYGSAKTRMQMDDGYLTYVDNEFETAHAKARYDEATARVNVIIEEIANVH
ncbi:hypothetical protein vBEnt31_000240 [Enterobacter phage vB_Ent31]|jgi:cell division protein FtsB|nr:hypothetical protein vBEnt31_000240 [Enterobacter phage vB_Ent31]